MKKLLAPTAGALIIAAAVTATPTAAALDAPTVPARTTISIRNNDGHTSDSPGAHTPGPAMSLAKLYLGHWVLNHGSAADKARVSTMIRYSDDRIASELDHTYPHAIADTIRDYHLTETHPGTYWGNVTTSVADVARFLDTIRTQPADAPLIAAMATVAPTAADGYQQNYGTHRIPGVWATKFGWEDDGSANATASIGPDYVIVARTYGTTADMNHDLIALTQPTVAPTAPSAEHAEGGQLTMPWLFGTTPAKTGTQVRAQTACADPLGLRMLLPEQALIPTFITRILPHC